MEFAVPSRTQSILDTLAQQGAVQVLDLATQLDVSAVTIRKDLKSLEQRGLLHRTRGGAEPRTRRGEGPFSDRMQADSAAKRAIAIEAATRVLDGDVIALDTSTTTHHLARLLLRRRGLVVVTSSLRTALLFHEHSDASIVMPGGVVRRESAGLVGSINDALRGRGRITKAFLGAVGVSASAGLLELAIEESEAKRQLVEASDAVIGVFAATKIPGFGLHSFARPEQISELITDTGATEQFVTDWGHQNVPVSRVSLNGEITATG